MSTLHFVGSAPSFRFNVASRPNAVKPVRLHLTRRGWIVLVAVPLALLAAAVLIFGSFFTSQARAATVGGAVSDTVRVNVASGETLWALAAEYAPERDPRAVVEEIVELNALASSTVQAGQSLHIPVGAP